MGLAGLTRVIAARTYSVTFERVTESKGSLDEVQTTTSEFTEDVWLFEERESVSEELAGERLTGSLGGLAVADGTVDIQHNDRITYGGVEYEVDTVMPRPNGDSWGDGTWSEDEWSGIEIDFWLVSFTRRQ